MKFYQLARGVATVLALSCLQQQDVFVRAAEESVVAPEASVSETSGGAPFKPSPNAESFEFQAEVHRMLDIVVNSLYQNKDVFLRELISNASDALDKIRFLALTKPGYLEGKPEIEVRVQYDIDAKTLTITDSGIGMTHDDLINNLGTVARSGTTKFIEALGEGSADMGMIGQFGVGFYSTFLVADKVSVASKHPDDPIQHLWESVNGESSFYVSPDPRGNTLGRGTEITLHFKEDAEEYADAVRLKDLVTHYSEFITHPIFLRTTSTVQVEDEDVDADSEIDEVSESDDLEVGEEETKAKKEEKKPSMKDVVTHSWEKLNPNAAIWTRDKDTITDDEYQAFFKVVSKEPQNNSSAWSHFDAEGNINFKSILYLPEELPANLRVGNFDPEKGGLKLYVRKVLISDEFELLPRYLSFVKGVVDSDDLPLNVNRETLQESKIIKIIAKKVVRKTLEMIRKLSEKEVPSKEAEAAEAEIDADGNILDPEKSFDYDQPHPYLAWYKKFAPSLKMGIIDDEANKLKLAKLLRYRSSKSGEKDIGFEDYVGRMKEWQNDIYFYAGTSIEEMEKSHFMEKFIEKDVEVLYFTEPVDEYMIGQLREYSGKRFSSITKENINFNDEDDDLVKRRDKVYKEQFKPLTKWLGKLYGPSIMRVAISKRLGSAPAIVSSSEYGHSANMERIMRAQAFQHGQDESAVKAMRVLEINPRHPFVLKLLENSPPTDGDKAFVVPDTIKDSAWNLLDMALLNGGFPIHDNKAYSKRMTRVLQTQMGVDSLDLAPEINPPVEEDTPPEIDSDGSNGINVDDFDFDEFDS